MKPSSFENAIRLQFDCLARKVIGRTVKNYNKELARRAKHEISFCEIPELELNQLGVSDEYSLEFTSFDVFWNYQTQKSQRFWIFPETLFIETECVH